VNRCTSRSCRVNVVRKQISFIETDAEFLQFAQAVTREPYSAVLLSGGALAPQDENRYSMVAWDPYLVFQSKETSCTLRTSKNEFIHSGDPLQKLDELFNSFQPNFPLVCTPFSGGAIGYIAYDLKNRLEKLPQTAHDDLHLPDLLFFWPRQFLVFDRALKRADLLIFQYETDPYSASTNVLDFVNEVRKPEPFIVGPLRSNFKHLEYIDAVRRVRRYIRQGDVYQVNLSQRYQFPLQGDSFQLWRSLFELNPAPFYAFIQAGGHQVLSTSMERFLFRRGRYMETRPIKGTRKRGANPEEDEALRLELLNSYKDDAELSMIVDLLRNDLGRVCLPRTIRVAEHKRLESYQNVHHLVSIVIGQLRERATYGDIIRATFPGGSITGCPKIRAMEIIDELEPHVRHIYTGAIGYLGWHSNMDLNVAIRTALIYNGNCYFSVGGGIVYDSEEEDEYQETLHKGRTLFQLIERLGEN
jgi:para-aminobenzoate synthetase component I